MRRCRCRHNFRASTVDWLSRLQLLLCRNNGNIIPHHCQISAQTTLANMISKAICSLIGLAVCLPMAISFSTTSPASLGVRSTIVTPPTTYNPFILSSPGSNNQLKKYHRTSVRMTSDAALPADGASEDSSPATDSNDSNDSGATVTELIFNLIKGIVGAGVLSLPAGIAAWGSAPSAVIPAVALIAIIGALSGYGFALIGRCCAYTNTESYRDAWSATVSEKSSWIPACAVTFKTICAVLAYSMILVSNNRCRCGTI